MSISVGSVLNIKCSSCIADSLHGTRVALLVPVPELCTRGSDTTHARLLCVHWPSRFCAMISLCEVLVFVGHSLCGSASAEKSAIYTLSFNHQQMWEMSLLIKHWFYPHQTERDICVLLVICRLSREGRAQPFTSSDIFSCNSQWTIKLGWVSM